MQLAGIRCAVCKENVMLAADATWCARCSSVIHIECLSRAEGICPTCLKLYDKPETYFVFSQMCPECFRPNNPPQARCARCSAGTRWDTQAAYEQFLAHMKDTSQVCMLRGGAGILGSAACLFVLVALLCFAPMTEFAGYLVLGCMLFATYGLVSFMRGRRIARFR